MSTISKMLVLNGMSIEMIFKGSVRSWYLVKVMIVG